MAALMRQEQYKLDGMFEQQVVLLACTSKQFWGLVGYAVEPDLLGVKAAQHIYRACHAIAKDTGVGPESTTVVMQRIARLLRDGKLSNEDVDAAYDYIEEAEDHALQGGALAVDVAVKELTPVLRRKMGYDLVHAALECHKSGSDFGQVATMLNKLNQVGSVDTSIGTRIGPEVFEQIREHNHSDRLTTGIVEVDTLIEDGPPRGSLGVFLGPSGSGKSMSLGQTFVAALMQRRFCLYATLELPEAVIHARHVSAITDTLMNEVQSADGSPRAKEAYKRLAQCIGVGIVKDFPPLVTTVQDITQWAKECEKREGRKVDLLVVDYADRLGGPKGMNEYAVGRVVYEGLIGYSKQHGCWVWTACQATRDGKGKGKRARVDLDDAADSMHKVRIANLIITINLTVEDGDTFVTFYVAKNTHGPSRLSTDALPVHWHVGRMTALYGLRELLEDCGCDVGVAEL